MKDQFRIGLHRSPPGNTGSAEAILSLIAAGLTQRHRALRLPGPIRRCRRGRRG